ncbi:unnamed protein product, partial [Ixodes hexagonus]
GPSPEYVVFPKLLESRGLNGEKLLYISDDLTLRLEKTSVLAENTIVSTLSGSEQIDTVVDGKEVEKNIYHDRGQMAAVEVSENGGTVEVHGILSQTLRIAPLPLMRRSDDGWMAHKVFEIEEPAEHKTDYIVPEERNILTRRPTRPAVKVPSVFQVEVGMIFDSYHSKNFPSERSLLVYAALTIEMVNLRYASTSNPRVKFVLVGVVRITKGDSFTTTVVGPDVMSPRTRTKRYMLSDTTLENLAKAVRTKKVEVEADLVVLVTSLDLADISNGVINNGVLGVAYLGGVCNSHIRVAQTEDAPGTHTMVSTLVHEMGHSLGMVHDGDRPKYQRPGSTPSVCSASHGYIMAPVANGDRNGQWSPCSMEQLSAFIVTLTEECFKLTAPKHYKINMTVLPGARLGNLEFCKKLFPGISGMSVNAVRLSCFKGV